MIGCPASRGEVEGDISHARPQPLDPNYFDEPARKQVEARLVHRLKRLGFEVELKPIPKAASAGFSEQLSW